ncbi:glycine betaine transporter [Prauserella aidingensis]|uniref:BCCT family transporter n=1 Tax=Prauserella aidingensis TaxID=387890 RepID=UPI0020A3E3AA|nr:BCCT family transporter [Prauserella aidingensis]MCP2253091.1 glycine betaine transporter [Prauserella aidingensis]
MSDPTTDGTAGRPRLGPVFYVSLVLSVGFIAVGFAVPSRVADALDAARRLVVGTFGPAYPITVLVLLVFVAALAVTPFGRMRLGTADTRPEFGRLSWLAMLLSAGVGLSFLFWGTAEPLIHLADPPGGVAEPGSAEAAAAGVRYSFLFWGLHAWAIYAVVGIAVGYSSFRHGRKLLVSAALRPLLGSRVDGPLGKVVDILAVFAILFGVATSLGLGTRELNAGLGHVLDVPESYGVKIAIIAGLMTVSTISAMTGLGRGIRVLSLVNIALCAVLLGFVLILGPTADILGTLGTGLRDYVGSFVPMSLATEGAAGDTWTQEWIFFFWAWWIGWAPFVGTFIARISRGRTIRSVVAGVVLVPTAVSVGWFSVFGGTALQREQAGTVAVSDVAGNTKSVATVEVLGSLPGATVAFVLLVPVLALLFITSADSASFMLGSTTSGGSMKPPRPLRLMWSFAAAFAAVLLLGRGVTSLQGSAVVAAAPFAVILIGLCVSLTLSLWRDRAAERAGRPVGGDPPDS